MIAGSATAASAVPQITVYGVEPEAGDDTRRSLQEGRRVGTEVPNTIADGLRVSTPGELTFPIVQALVKEVLLVSDAEMVETLTFLLERAKVLVEPSGAALPSGAPSQADFSGQKVGLSSRAGKRRPPALARTSRMVRLNGSPGALARSFCCVRRGSRSGLEPLVSTRSGRIRRRADRKEWTSTRDRSRAAQRRADRALHGHGARRDARDRARYERAGRQLRRRRARL